MGFRTDAFAKVWAIENKGNYSVVDMSISKKNEAGGYDVTFSNKFVRFIGTAHTLADGLKKGDTIKIGNCDVTSVYDKEKKATYTNFLVFSFENPNGGTSGGSKPEPSKVSGDGFMNIPDGIDEELPFN
jgi:hypothetical protein